MEIVAEQIKLYLSAILMVLGLVTGLTGVDNTKEAQHPITTEVVEEILPITTEPVAEVAVEQPVEVEQEPQIIYVKPDYSELIKQLRKEIECWEGVEYKRISVTEQKKECPKSPEGEVEDKSSKYSRMLDKIEKCGPIISIKEVPYPDEEKKEIIEKIEQGIRRLEDGVFIDIHNRETIPQCP